MLERDAPESFGGLVVTGRVVMNGLHALTDEMLAVQRERLAAVRRRQDAITDRLVRSADAALYRAKAAGRDRVELAN